MSETLTKDQRNEAMSRFFSIGQILSMQAGQSKRFVCLTDVDGFEPVMVHRTGKGRVYCPFTKDPEGASCPLCAKGTPRTVLAVATIWNFTDKVRQIALWSGPKRGPLHQLRTIFNIVGTYKVLIEMNREGSGQDTNYTLVSVSSDVEIPAELEPFTRAEILEMAAQTMREREGDSEW